MSGAEKVGLFSANLQNHQWYVLLPANKNGIGDHSNHFFYKGFKALMALQSYCELFFIRLLSGRLVLGNIITVEREPTHP